MMKNGIIHLIDSDDTWAYGHIDNAEATHLAFEHAEGEEDPGPCVAEHTYARWLPADETERALGFSVMFHPNWESGHGAFKVSRIVTVAQAERERLAREVWRKNHEAMRAAVTARFSMATDVEVSGGWPGSETHAEFVLPGLQGRARGKLGPPSEFTIELRDHPAFLALYGAKDEA